MNYYEEYKTIDNSNLNSNSNSPIYNISVIYKIEVPYNEPLLTQFNTLGEFEEAEQLQQKKKK